MQHGAGVDHEIEGGHASEELMDRRGDHTAWTGHPLHFRNDLLNLGNDIQSQRGNGSVEFAVVEPHVADIAVLISDVGVGSAKAGSFQVSLGRVDTNYVGARLGQGLRQHACPTGHIEHAPARSNIGTGEKWLCQ